MLSHTAQMISLIGTAHFRSSDPVRPLTLLKSVVIALSFLLRVGARTAFQDLSRMSLKRQNPTIGGDAQPYHFRDKMYESASGKHTHGYFGRLSRFRVYF
jgi:hypothetical protein